MKRAFKIFWKTGIEKIDSQFKKDKNYYQTFKPYWKQVKDKIKIDNALLILNEEGIEKMV